MSALWDLSLCLVTRRTLGLQPLQILWMKEKCFTTANKADAALKSFECDSLLGQKEKKEYSGQREELVKVPGFLMSMVCFRHGELSGWLVFTGAMAKMRWRDDSRDWLMKFLEGHTEDSEWHLVGYGHYWGLGRRATD